MQRWPSVFLLLLLAAFAVLVVVKGGPHPTPATVAPTDAGADASDAATEGGARDAATESLDAGDSQGAESATERVDAGGTLLLNGQPAPPIGADAPKSVVWGAILISYKGAQGAPPNARTREDALSLANDLLPVAKTDFKAAVDKGDKGSMENLGRMPRGVLEPAPEYVLFGLGKGEVGGPIDTPRGYWIVQRIE
jgi:hypothetical protein